MAERHKDTPTTERQDASQRTAEDDAKKSTQAQFSTYSENTDLPDDNPPPGRHVVQELGEPAEGPTVQGA